MKHFRNFKDQKSRKDQIITNNHISVKAFKPFKHPCSPSWGLIERKKGSLRGQFVVDFSITWATVEQMETWGVRMQFSGIIFMQNACKRTKAFSASNKPSDYHANSFNSFHDFSTKFGKQDPYKAFNQLQLTNMAKHL